MTAHSLALIDEFLAAKRIAAVGVSRNKKHFSRTLLDEFVSRGYEMLPVNPSAQEIAGLFCFTSVVEIAPPPEAALILTPAEQSRAVIERCASAGIRLAWLYRAVGHGSVSCEALEAADALGVRVVAGECPFMFFPNTGFIHRIHHGWRALTGTLPH